jgi:hypothetical protein
MDTIICLIDGAAGIYVPRNFYERFDLDSWNLDTADLKDLSNPYNDLYWDAWDDVLRNAEFHDDNGHIWRLYQDGDLFAVRDDHNWEDSHV